MLRLQVITFVAIVICAAVYSTSAIPLSSYRDRDNQYDYHRDHLDEDENKKDEQHIDHHDLNGDHNHDHSDQHENPDYHLVKKPYTNYYLDKYEDQKDKESIDIDSEKSDKHDDNELKNEKDHKVELVKPENYNDRFYEKHYKHSTSTSAPKQKQPVKYKPNFPAYYK